MQYVLERYLTLFIMYTGGLTEFNVLHPSLCEINLPKIKKSLGNTPQQRATTPGTMHALTLPHIHFF